MAMTNKTIILWLIAWVLLNGQIGLLLWIKVELWKKVAIRNSWLIKASTTSYLTKGDIIVDPKLSESHRHWHNFTAVLVALVIFIKGFLYFVKKKPIVIFQSG